MKKTKKIAIIIGIALVVAGMFLSVGATAAMDFDFSKMNSLHLTTNIYQIDEPFSAIVADGTECDIRLLPSSDSTCRVVCDESDRIVHTVAVENGILTVERHDNRKWYERIGLSWGEMEIVIYLPQGELESLKLKSVSGDIAVSAGVTFTSAEIQSTSGDVRFSSAVMQTLDVKTTSGELYVSNTAPETLTVKSTSGDIELSGIRCGSLTVDVTSGDADLSDVVASGHLKIECVSGDVELSRCDGAALWIKTVSGDVEGTLLTEKTFLTDTVSGEIRVPRGSVGGTCEIKTTSGDIELRVG